jgi:hypothetical protein
MPSATRQINGVSTSCSSGTGAAIDSLVIQSPTAIVSSLLARTAPRWVNAVARRRTGAGMAPPTVMAPGPQLSPIAAARTSDIEGQSAG